MSKPQEEIINNRFQINNKAGSDTDSQEEKEKAKKKGKKEDKKVQKKEDSESTSEEESSKTSNKGPEERSNGLRKSTPTKKEIKGLIREAIEEFSKNSKDILISLEIKDMISGQVEEQIKTQRKQTLKKVGKN